MNTPLLSPQFSIDYEKRSSTDLDRMEVINAFASRVEKASEPVACTDTHACAHSLEGAYLYMGIERSSSGSQPLILALAP